MWYNYLKQGGVQYEKENNNNYNRIGNNLFY